MLVKSASVFALLRSVNHFRTPASTLATQASVITDVIGSDPPMMIKYLEVGSTMDTAKDLLNGKEQVPSAFSHVSIDDDVFAVVADYQNQGRGTRGRTWTSASGNMYMTLVVKMDKIGIPLTLVPLRIGTLIAPSIRSRVGPSSSENVYLKWPNDVLIGDRKVCGTLIEIENGRLLVGIGCNVAEAPVVPGAGADKGRSSTSIQEHAREGEQHDATAIAAEIIQATKDWLSSRDSAEYVVNDFESAMAKGAVQTLRNGPDEGKQVIPLRINPDGTLHVKFAAGAVDGTFPGERTLIADYLV